MLKLDRRNFLLARARLLKQSEVNRLKVEHYRALTISRGFYDLLLKLDRRRLLVHGVRLLKQSGGKRKEASISGFNSHSAF